ncbi:MAG: L-seryl-tRNA(Sec) selenium transferase, partial [Burkholderiaceae bacterium]
MPDLTLPGAGDSSEAKTGGLKSNSSPGAAARLPAVDRLLASPQLNAVAADHGTLQVKRAVQEVLAENRTAIVAGATVPDSETLIAQVQQRLSQVWSSRLRPVFNLTGTVIHTNLGRALLAEEAITAVAIAMRSYTNLEYDVGSGGRGDRDHIVEDLLRELTGAEAATVVNNNAAAVLLSLKALSARKEAIISRGELIEIGGAFRMPDIMKAAGCKLVEVGTTNRTHARDYEDACGPRTGLIVKAHWSN